MLCEEADRSHLAIGSGVVQWRGATCSSSGHDLLAALLAKEAERADLASAGGAMRWRMAVRFNSCEHLLAAQICEQAKHLNMTTERGAVRWRRALCIRSRKYLAPNLRNKAVGEEWRAASQANVLALLREEEEHVDPAVACGKVCRCGAVCTSIHQDLWAGTR